MTKSNCLVNENKQCNEMFRVKVKNMREMKGVAHEKKVFGNFFVSYLVGK